VESLNEEIKKIGNNKKEEVKTNSNPEKTSFIERVKIWSSRGCNFTVESPPIHAVQQCNQLGDFLGLLPDFFGCEGTEFEKILATWISFAIKKDGNDHEELFRFSYTLKALNDWAFELKMKKKEFESSKSATRTITVPSFEAFESTETEQTLPFPKKSNLKTKNGKLSEMKFGKYIKTFKKAGFNLLSNCLSDKEREITVFDVKNRKSTFILTPKEIFLHFAGTNSSKPRDYSIQSVLLSTTFLSQTWVQCKEAVEGEKFDEQAVRNVFVQLLTNLRNNSLPCLEWLKMRVTQKDRQHLIENILFNCELKIKKSNDEPKSLHVKESDDVPSLPDHLHLHCFNQQQKQEVKYHFNQQKNSEMQFKTKRKRDKNDKRKINDEESKGEDDDDSNGKGKGEDDGNKKVVGKKKKK